jgi:hypothetical protein
MYTVCTILIICGLRRRKTLFAEVSADSLQEARRMAKELRVVSPYDFCGIDIQHCGKFVESH